MQKTKQKPRDDIRDKDREWIARFCLMDDIFLNLIFQKIQCTELLLRLILGRKDLKVQKVGTQRDVKNLWGRSARLDILAEDEDGKYYNIEVQRKDEGADPRRARYYSALLDTHVTEPGEHFENIAETYVIFITENDVLGADKPLYHIDRIIRETGEDFKDGAHIIYVNSQIQDETALGRLMHDFYCKNPDEMHHKILADEVRYFKEDTKGVKKMCQIMEEIIGEGEERGLKKGRKEGRKEGRIEGRIEGRMEHAQQMAVKMATRGDSLEEIADIVGYDTQTVKTWLGNQSPAPSDTPSTRV